MSFKVLTSLGDGHQKNYSVKTERRYHDNQINKNGVLV